MISNENYPYYHPDYSLNLRLKGNPYQKNKYKQFCGIGSLELLFLNSKSLSANFDFDDIDLLGLSPDKRVTNPLHADETITGIITVGIKLDDKIKIQYPLTNFLPIRGFEPANYEEQYKMIAERQRLFPMNVFRPKHILPLTKGRININLLKLIREKPDVTQGEFLVYLRDMIQGKRVAASLSEYYIMDQDNWKYIMPLAFDFIEPQ